MLAFKQALVCITVHGKRIVLQQKSNTEAPILYGNKVCKLTDVWVSCFCHQVGMVCDTLSML